MLLELKFKVLLMIIYVLLNNTQLKGFVKGQETCLTPDNDQGLCLPYKQCKKYFEFLKKNFELNDLKKILRQSLCKPNTISHICCNEIFLTAHSLYGTNEYTSSLNERGVRVLSAHQCGNVATRRIAHGTKARPGEFPWMALLEYDSSLISCGASLISDRYVLTAAHCLLRSEKVVNVIFGAHNLDTDLETTQTIKIPVEEIIPHERYSKYNSVAFDIGLIRLSSSIELTKRISPICLPITPFALGEKEQYKIAGWGITENGTTSRVLQKATITYRSPQECQSSYKRLVLTTQVMCAGGDGPIDNCRGDSGGPLFVNSNYLPSKYRYVQYGIISLGGTKCGDIKNSPSIYTNVTEFMPWITNNLQK